MVKKIQRKVAKVESIKNGCEMSAHSDATYAESENKEPEHQIKSKCICVHLPPPAGLSVERSCAPAVVSH